MSRKNFTSDQKKAISSAFISGARGLVDKKEPSARIFPHTPVQQSGVSPSRHRSTSFAGLRPLGSYQVLQPFFLRPMDMVSHKRPLGVLKERDMLSSYMIGGELLASLLKRRRYRIITAIATNGACIIHDFELSFIGHTSEDVGEELNKATFGMAKETGRFLNRAITNGVNKGYGIGKSVGELISKGRFRFKEMSIFATAYELGTPASVHIAMGTDIIHMHPDVDGCAIGEGSFRDFRLLCSVVSDLDRGVYINLGSAVIMPEVFLKALTVARNLGNQVENITTINMDFIQHYRTRENVLKRPTHQKGSAYALTGHHEIMFPLLAAAA